MKQADIDSLKQDWWVFPLFLVVLIAVVLFL